MRSNRKARTSIVLAFLMVMSTLLNPAVVQSDEFEGIDALSEDTTKSTSHSTTNSVMISEVLLDPLGDTSGASVIVIRNYGTESADISGWNILAESYEVIHQFSEPTTLGAFTSMYIHLEQAGIVPESASIQQVYVMPSNLIFLTEQLDSVSSESLGLGDYAISTGSFSLWTSNDDIVDYLRWEESSGGADGTLEDAVAAGLWEEDYFLDIEDSLEGKGIARLKQHYINSQEDWTVVPDTQQSSVVINEILLSSGDTYSEQWVEIYNPGPAMQQMDGWTLRNSTGTVFEFPDSFTILSKEHAVITFKPGESSNIIGPEKPRNYFHSRFFQSFAPTDHPLQSSGDLLALQSIDRFGSKSVVDYVEWGHSLSSSFSSQTASEGHWPAGLFVDTSGLSVQDSIGRDRSSTDTDSSVDWATNGGSKANGPTRGYMNMLRVFLSPGEWTSQNKVISLTNNGSALDLSGWEFLNIYLDESISIPQGTSVPSDSVIEIKFGNGVDDTDFSDGVGSVHLGPIFDINAVGYDALFLRTSTDGLSDLVGLVVFSDGVPLEDESSGLGRGWLSTLCDWTICGLVKLIVGGLEWLYDKFVDFLHWLVEIGYALVEAAWSWAIGALEEFISVDSVTDALDLLFDVDWDDDPEQEGLEWILTISGPSATWGIPKIEIWDTITFFLGIKVDGELEIVKEVNGDVSTSGSLEIEAGLFFDFDLDVGYADVLDINVTALATLEIAAGNYIDVKTLEDNITRTIFSINLDFDYALSAKLFGWGGEVMSGSANLFSYEWSTETEDTEMEGMAISDSQKHLMILQNKKFFEDFSFLFGDVDGDQLINTSLQESPSPGDEYNITFKYNKYRYDASDLTIEEELGWMTDTTIWPQPQNEMQYLFGSWEYATIILDIPEVNDLAFVEDIAFSDSRQYGCEDSIFVLEVDVENSVDRNTMIADEVIITAINSNNVSDVSTLDLSIVVPELYSISATSENGWGVEVVGGEEQVFFEKSQASTTSFEILAPFGTPPGTFDNISISIESIYNPGNSISYDFQVMAPDVPKQLFFWDPIIPTPSWEWTASGDWVHGAPSQPTGENQSVWSSNPSGEPSSTYSILKSPIIDLTGHDSATLIYDEWVNIPLDANYWPSAVAVVNLDTGDLKILDLRVPMDTGGWNTTGFILTDEMMNERTQFQFHYFTPVQRQNPYFWMIKDFNICTCNVALSSISLDDDSRNSLTSRGFLEKSIDFELDNDHELAIRDIDIEWELEMTEDVPWHSNGFEQGDGGWDGSSPSRSVSSGWRYNSNALVGTAAHTESDGTFDVGQALLGEYNNGRDTLTDNARAASIRTMKGKGLIFDISQDAENDFIGSPNFDLSSLSNSQNLYIKMDIGLSDRLSEDDINLYQSTDGGVTWSSLGAVSDQLANSTTFWAGYDDLGWIQWISIEVPLSDSVSAQTKFGIAYDGLRIGRNGEHVLLDNFEIITRTTSIVASNNDRVDIEAGERNTFSYQYDYSQDERTTARYDLRIQQDTNGRRTETTLSETHARGTTVIIDDELRNSVNVNMQPLDLSVSMTNNGFVNYFLTDERGATVMIGSSMTFPNAEASGEIIGLAGQFTLTAVHTDNWGRQVSDNTTIRLFSDAPPVAILELPVEKILQGALLNLSGLQSTDDNGIVEYDWRISGPEEYSFNTSEISFTPTTLGVYQVRLVVSDEWGQSDILLSNFSVSSSDYEAVDLPDDPNVDLPDDPNSSTSSESDILMGIFGLLFLVLLISAVRNRRRQ